MTVQTDKLKILYNRLDSIGFKKSYLKQVLPSWWEDEIADLPTGLLQLKFHFARHLGLDFESLLDDNKQIIFSPLSPCNFKRKDGKTSDISQIIAITTQAASIARLATVVNDVPNSSFTASSIRQEILHDNSVVSLPALLDFCWKIGIPVLTISKFPKAKENIEGMAINIEEKPVIVLVKEHKKHAWALFIIAHELGHIFKGHLAADKMIIDDKSIGKETSSEQEKEANEFALELLTGSRNTQFATENNRWLDGEKLANAAKEYGNQHCIDAGHIALNYANGIGKFSIANAALNILEPNVDAPALVREKMQLNLDLTQIPEDSADFLFKISGVSLPQ
jgi:Zn-dependent peptidase ImmA (M78 family)